MITIRFVTILFIVILANSCKKEQVAIDCCSTQDCECLGPVYNMILNFEDSLGNDLLNINNENHLEPSQFSIFHFFGDSAIDSRFDYGLSNSNNSMGQIGVNFKGDLKDSINYFLRITSSNLDTISVNWEKAKVTNDGNYNFYYNSVKYENQFMKPVLVTKTDF